MNTAGDSQTQTPVFKWCPRCRYSLRGLPANHVCPECGLRYDEDCELYIEGNARPAWRDAVFGVLLLMGYYMFFLSRFATASFWGQVGTLAGLALLLVVISAGLSLRRDYPRGFSVAITQDGLLCRFPGLGGALIPWQNIDGASIEDRPHLPPVACVHLKNSKEALHIPRVHKFFRAPADMERFVGQVNKRAKAKAAEPASGDEDGSMAPWYFRQPD